MIQLRNVNKYYQSGSEKIHVLNNLNYTFPDSGLVFILGPSGSGKSTLLNLLGGLDKPDSGEILIENRNISTFTKAEHTNYLNSYLGFVFQEYNILKDLTLKQNISLSLEIQGQKRKYIKQKVKQIIDEVELTGLEKRKVSQLSGGQKQRIAIARALVKDPELIIADEPTGNLDSSTSKRIFELLKKLSKNRLIIVVTHDEESANLYADDILRIDTAKLDDENENSENSILENDHINLMPTRKLYLEKAKTPYKTILKLASKNIWRKKFQYLLIFFISIICSVFLSFAIELNGDKLYQNVYTTVENGINYTDIYQYHPTSTSSSSKDFYAKYTKGELMDGAYDIIKHFTNDLIIHKYQTVNVDYSKYNIEKANFLYSGTINTIIEYDPSNTYELLAGTLPNSHEPEILITDFLLDALKHFGIVSTNTTIYSIINTYLDLGYSVKFKVVGVIQTNYHKWLHLSRLKSNYKVDPYDDDMQGFEYDYLVMNSIIVGEEYYNYILTDSFSNTTILVNNKDIDQSGIVAYDNQEIRVGRAPQAPNEIVVPKQLFTRIFNLSSGYYDSNYRMEYYINNYSPNAIVSTKFNEINTETGNYDINSTSTFKVVGVTSSSDFIITSESLKSYKEAITQSQTIKDPEKVIVELSKDPSVVMEQFKTLYNNDYHFIIDIFDYQTQIESYDVDPVVEFASKGGLIIFTILTIGIMWTIISIEIVDSKKEIGILRSIGINGKKVSLIFLLQSLFVNILAYLISLPISRKVIEIFGSNITDPLGEIKLSLYTTTYRTPIYLIIFIVAITIISTIIPLINIMSKKIINIINEREN